MRGIGAAITGAAGFLGAHLVRGFEGRGARVLPLVRSAGDRSPAGARTLDSALLDSSAFTEIDVVVHAAAVRHKHGIDAPTYRSSNVDLVERTLRVAAKARVRRFVLVSSVEVYGFPPRLPVTEDYPYAPRALHAALKVEAEMRARRAARELGIDLCIVRPTMVYGPGDRDGVIAKMAATMRNSTYRVVGTGDNVLHHVYVDDVVEGVWLAATHAAAAGEHFILAGPETTSLAALSELVARSVGRPLPRRHVSTGIARAVATVVDIAADRGIAFMAREPAVNHEKLDVLTLPLYFDIAKARRCLGFSPRVSYEEGVMRTLQGGWPESARVGAGT